MPRVGTCGTFHVPQGVVSGGNEEFRGRRSLAAKAALNLTLQTHLVSIGASCAQHLNALQHLMEVLCIAGASGRPAREPAAAGGRPQRAPAPGGVPGRRAARAAHLGGSWQRCRPPAVPRVVAPPGGAAACAQLQEGAWIVCQRRCGRPQAVPGQGASWNNACSGCASVPLCSTQCRLLICKNLYSTVCPMSHLPQALPPIILQCPSDCPIRPQLCQLLLSTTVGGSGSLAHARALVQLLPLMRGGDRTGRAVAQGLQAVCSRCSAAQLDAAFKRAMDAPLQASHQSKPCISWHAV